MCIDEGMPEYQCGFKKGCSAQQCLVVEKNSVDKGKVLGTHLMDISRALDFLSQELIIEK